MRTRRLAVLTPLLLILVCSPVPGAVAPRQDGDTYSEQWRMALGAGVEPALVTITSFNEWHEGTQIEPAAAGATNGSGYTYDDYGSLPPGGYLALTREWVDQLDTIWPEVDQKSITVATLLAEMTNLDRLTNPANYTTRQFSSYDRSSVSADAPGWFANGDGGNYLRQDGDEYVLAEASGPGAIVRIWVGNPSGTIRIYLDDEVVLTADLFELLNGDIPPFVTPFGATRALGGNLYFPFPYREKMKITGTANDLYYHLGYRTYPKGTKVTTYSLDQVPPNLPTLIEPAPRGEKTTETQLVGPGVVRRLEIELPDNADLLREETVEIIVDGKRTVWSPLGDFFGTAPGRTPYDSLPLGITEQGVGYSNFPMPFSESLEIIVNEPVTMWVSDESRPLRFFAWWRGHNAVNTRPFTDQPVLNVTGQGRFVGLFLGIRNPSLHWWGEGDEKIFVDGEGFPSHFGTGTEDYFGYAYGDPELFQAPYHNQTRADGPMSRGYVANARFDIFDDIPFQSAIRFDMELWHWKRAAVGFSTVAYWYAAPDATHDFVELPLSERKIRPVAETYVAPGAIEGETMLANQTGGATYVRSGQDWMELSGDKALVWHDASPGDRLNLDFQADEGGDQHLALAVVAGENSGRYDVYLNGTQVVESMDLFIEGEPGGVEEIELEAPVIKGTNTLEVVYTGANPEADEPIFALDYIVTLTYVITRCFDFVDPVGVGLEDVMAVAAHWGQQSGDEGWDPRFDLDSNGRVDILDVMSVVAALGSTCPTESCIPSGDQNSINDALTDVGSAAILCQNAVFELTGPVVFTHDRQAVYTEGFPTGSSRALLRVVDEGVTVAVNLEDRSEATLSHVIVDGNRPNLGPADGGEALIQAGGAASGQVIEWVKAYEPRFWSILHAFEGPDLSCSGTQIRNNDFGPAGMPDGTWADGISLACRNSVVADNTITDATDGAVVIFGAPGSLIENNIIRAETRVLLGGIHMVAYHPFDGDYTGVRVTGNVIDAAGQHIKIGVAIGERVWGCLDPNEPDLPPDPVLRGGSVISNTLMGDNMRYGFAVDGVEDWTMLGNIDLSRHSGVPIHECHGQIPSPPSGFQFYSQRATGTFQPEFEEAYLENALWAIDPYASAFSDTDVAGNGVTKEQDKGSQLSDGREPRMYYVNVQDPNASDANDGLSPSWDSETGSGPFKTIGHAMSVVEPGDVAYVRAGLYEESDLRFNHSGEEGAPIMLSAYPTDNGFEAVAIDGLGGADSVNGITVADDQSFIILQKFEIRNMPNVGIAMGESTRHRGIVIKDVVVRGNRIGIALTSTDAFELESVEAFDNAEDGIRLQAANNGSVKNSYAHHNAAGFRLISSSNNLLEHNTATENFVTGFFLGSESNDNTLRDNLASGNQAEDGFTVSMGARNVLVDNEAYGNGKRGFQLTDQSKNNLVENNLAHNNGVLGFAIYVDSTDNMLRANTSHSHLFHGFVFLAGASNNLVEDNVSFGNRRCGFYFESAYSNEFRSNDAHENGFDGFTMFLGSADNLFEGNTADRNGGWGFLSDYDSPNGDLRAGNSANENGAGEFGEVDFEAVDFAAYTDINNPC